MAYSTESEVRLRLGSPDSTKLPSATVVAAIVKADALIDAYLASRYVVPFTGTIPALVSSLSQEIAAYYAAMGAYASAQSTMLFEIVVHVYKEAIRLLKDIAKGRLNVPGATILASTNSPFWSSTTDSLLVFNLDDCLHWGADGLDLEDLEDDRDDRESTLPQEFSD